MSRLLLSCIVKNETDRIERMLKSVEPYIDGACVHDTGSTDDTVDKVIKFFQTAGKPVHISRGKFEDFSQARNEALRSARVHNLGCDWILLCDADMELKVRDPSVFKNLDGESIAMYQAVGSVYYQNARLLRLGTDWQYVGVTHEYLGAPYSGCIPMEAAAFLDHADGANRHEKYKRDIKLLKRGLKAEPNNERYFYYLAQSYRDAGELQKAAEWYKRRAGAGGWPEEAYSAQYCLAHCLRELGDEAGFIRTMLEAYNMRPTRAEPLHDLAFFYREKDGAHQQLGAMFAERAMEIRRPDDMLFINDFVYTAGAEQEFAICGFYVPEKRVKAFHVTNNLALRQMPYGPVIGLARRNLFHYLPRLRDMLHSYVERKIDFQPEEGWVALNPSVVLHDGCLIAVIRTVNYRISEQGQYLIRGTDGTANATNPINTRNWLACFNDDMSLVTSSEIANPVGMPCEFPLVIGFEDMRLFSHGGHLYASATARQFHIDGNCEQVLIRLGLNPMCVAEYKRMLREPRETQKNWMPIDQAPEIQFMYRLGEVVNSEGVTVANRPTKLATNQICGGTQLIRFVGGYLCLVHESNPRPDTGVRYYQHRFVWCDDAFDNYKISLPFMFEDKVIEYASGLCWHPDGKRLVISYGFKDCEARLATIDAMELSAELGAAGSHLW